MGGEYEDAFDYIIGSYLHRERAERELEKLNDLLDGRYMYYQKCSNCSAQFGCSVNEIDEIRENCDCFSAEDDEALIGFCKNAVCSYDENMRYKIEEVNVDEEEIEE